MEAYLDEDTEGVPFIQIGEYILRLDLEDLDDAYSERAKNELRETTDVVATAIEQLKDFIKDEEALSIPIDNESFLLKFLRPCKFYPESTFRLMKRYYKFIAKNPKYASELMPSTVSEVYARNIIQFLPLRVNGSRVMVVDISYWHPKNLAVNLLFKAVIMALEIAMTEPRTQVGGVYVLLDVDGLVLTHVLQFSPMLAKLIIDFVQECTAIRLKGIHIVNQPFIFNMGFAIFKPFIGRKLKERLFFHGKDYTILQNHIHKECLPVKYGGDLELPYVGTLLVELLKRYEKDFEELTHYGYAKDIDS